MRKKLLSEIIWIYKELLVPVFFFFVLEPENHQFPFEKYSRIEEQTLVFFNILIFENEKKKKKTKFFFLL